MAAYDITFPTTALNFASISAGNRQCSVPLSSTRVVVVWQGSLTEKYVQTLELNRSTGVLTANDSPLNFYSTSYSWATDAMASIVPIDATHFAIFWSGSGDDGFCRTFEVNAGTGAVTAWGAQVEFDTTQGTGISSLLMANDGTNARILAAWSGSGNDGFSSIFTVTMSDGTIAVTGTPFEFDTTNTSKTSVSKISSTKVIVGYVGPNSDGYTRVLDVNTSTWAVTGAGSSSSFRTSNTTDNPSIVVSSLTPLVAVIASYEVTADDEDAQPLSINDSTWDVTNLGSSTEITTGNNGGDPRILAVDSTHLVSALEVNGGSLSVRTYSIDNSTGTMTTLDTEEVVGTGVAYQSLCDMGLGMYVVTWAVSSTSMNARTFQVELPSTDSGAFFAVM